MHRPDQEPPMTFLFSLLLACSPTLAEPFVPGFVVAPPPVSAAPSVHFTVNGLQLSEGLIGQIRAAYGTVVPGDYWYDPVSGLFGTMGAGPVSQIAPGLDFGAPLPADASGTGTRAFINGREISRAEVIGLGGYVAPGRYFLRADGVWGIEGGAAMGRLGSGNAGGYGGGGYGGGYGEGGSIAVTRSGTGVISQAGGCGYVATGAGTVMTGNCPNY